MADSPLLAVHDNAEPLAMVLQHTNFLKLLGNNTHYYGTALLAMGVARRKSDHQREPKGWRPDPGQFDICK
jgi:hypothetical protein